MAINNYGRKYMSKLEEYLNKESYDEGKVSDIAKKIGAKIKKEINLAKHQLSDLDYQAVYSAFTWWDKDDLIENIMDKMSKKEIKEMAMDIQDSRSFR